MSTAQELPSSTEPVFIKGNEQRGTELEQVTIEAKRWAVTKSVRDGRDDKLLEIGVNLRNTNANVMTSEDIPQYAPTMREVLYRARALFPGLNNSGGKQSVRVNGLPTETRTYRTVILQPGESVMLERFQVL